MSKSRQIQVTTLTNLALTTWIFFSSGIKNMFCCGIITHPWNTQQQLAHLHTVGSHQSSFRNISDLVTTKARKCSDLSLIKKNVRHTFVVFFSVQDLELVIRIKVKTLYLIPHYFKGRCQKSFSGFCPLRGFPPPPTPLTENNFAKKPLAERGGTPPPWQKIPKKNSKKMGQKGLKLAFWPKIAVF